MKLKDDKRCPIIKGKEGKDNLQSCQVEHVEFIESVTSLNHPQGSSSSSNVGLCYCYCQAIGLGEGNFERKSSWCLTGSTPVLKTRPTAYICGWRQKGHSAIKTNAKSFIWLIKMERTPWLGRTL